MATVGDIINRAMMITGLQSSSQNLSAEDAKDGRLQINGIIDSWNTSKLKSFALSEASFTLVPGQKKYTIGPGGDFDTTRPVRIEYMFVRDPGGQDLDYRVTQLQYDAYKSIHQKNIQSYWPTYYYYNPLFPIGTLEVYPTPSKAYTLHITDWQQFGSYTSTADVISLPPTFPELLTYQLAVDMCSYNGKQVPPDVMRKYNELDYQLDHVVAEDLMPTKTTTTPTNFRGTGNGNQFRTYIPTGLG